MIETFNSCGVQEGSHYSHMPVEHLKCEMRLMRLKMEFCILFNYLKFLNSPIWLVATFMDSAFLEHTQNSIIRHITVIYTVIVIAKLPKIKNIAAPPWGTG